MSSISFFLGLGQEDFTVYAFNLFVFLYSPYLAQYDSKYLARKGSWDIFFVC